MPAKIKKLDDKFEVVNPESGVVHAKATTEKKAKAQKRILDAAAEAKAEPSVPIAGEGKPKRTSKWIEHIKAHASKHGISYAAALQHPELKDGYEAVPKSPRKPKAEKMAGAGVINEIPDQAVLGLKAQAQQMSTNFGPAETEALAAAKKVRKPRAKKVIEVVA
jgi:hypothetical protein